MSTDPDIVLLKRIFAPWRQTPAGNAFPAPASLARALDKAYPLRKGDKRRDTFVDIGVAKFFATAAVDIWQRAVHSLLISVLLTDESAIWSSVSGYYSSHYTMRGIAHLLGYFQLFQRKCTIQLSFDGSRYVCTYSRGFGREHEWYWDIVRKNSTLRSDPFFAANNLSQTIGDVAHRDRTNYWDHLPYFPALQDVNRDQVRLKVQQMAKMELLAPPALKENQFPDPVSVQLIAYQRVARFRRLLDETLVNNRLWNVHRSPPWAANYIDYQLVETRGAVQR